MSKYDVQSAIEKSKATLSEAGRSLAVLAIGEVVLDLHRSGVAIERGAIVTELLVRSRVQDVLLQAKFGHAATLLGHQPIAEG